MSTTPNPSFPSASQPPKKPISGKIMTYTALGGLFLAVVASIVVSLMTTSQPKAQPGEVQQPAGKPAVKGFSDDVERARDIIKQNSQNAAKVASIAEQLHTQLPDCNQQLRDRLKGEYYVVKSQDPNTPDMNLVCQPDDQWVALPPSIGQIQPETQAQANAENKTSANGGLTKAEKRKARRDAAFGSNPIPLHFADRALPAASQLNGEEAAEHDDPTPLESSPASTSPASAAAQTEVAATADSQHRPQLGVELSHHKGPQYPIFQGRILEGLLANRLIGEQGGPVKVQITTPVYSQDSQHLLIPPGSVLLGEATRVEASGEHRLAVLFHRIIMPDGWSFILDATKGLDQQGANGLTGKVNNHLASLIGTAVMVGAIEGLADFTNVGSGGAVVEVQSGMSRESSNESMQILRRTLNRPPAITVYEGTRVRVWVTRDQALPDYENHIVTTTVE